MSLNRARPLDAAATGLSGSEQAIAGSVLYAALFDYPLTLAQLRDTLIGSSQTSAEILATYAASPGLRSIVEVTDGFFHPRGAAHLVPERRRRERASRAFLARHDRFLRLICGLPYVRMVALSGSVAHLNLDGDGDLDLFIVSRAGRVWSVAVAVVVAAKLLRLRRTVCANFVVSEARLALEPQDLFSASQIIHLKPVSGDDVHRRLLAANPFVARFYPNFSGAGGGAPWCEPGARWLRLRRAIEWLAAGPSAAGERLCRAAYGWHLRRRRSSWSSPEQVRLEPECLKLHTQSHRRRVLERFDEAVRRALK